MDDWYPAAERSRTFAGAGAFVSGFPPRGVLHSTEGSTIKSALDIYPKTKAYPHFTLDANTVEQHCKITVSRCSDTLG